MSAEHFIPNVNDPKVLAEVDAWYEYMEPAREKENLRRQRAIVLRIHRELKGNITGPTVVGWLLKQLRVKQAAAETVKSEKQAMIAYLNWRHEFRGAPKIAVKLTIRSPVQPMPSMTEEDYKRLLGRLEHPQSLLWYGAYWGYGLRMGWHTGMRISDVACCKWENLSWSDKCLRVTPIKTSRRNIQVEIPLPDEFLDWLREYRAHPNYAFMSPDMHRLYHRIPKVIGVRQERRERFLTPSKVRARQGQLPVIALRGRLQEAFRALADSVGIDKTFHAFRHAFVTRHLAAGVSPAIITKITGQSLLMIERYNSPTSGMLRSALGYDKPQIEVLNQQPNEETA